MDQIIVHFCDNAERPLELDFGFFKRSVISRSLLFVVTIARNSATPRNIATPSFPHSKCSGQHQWKECSPNTESKCANCAGSHSANFPLCPTRQEPIRQARLFVVGPQTFGQTKRRQDLKKLPHSPPNAAGKRNKSSVRPDAIHKEQPEATLVSKKLTFAAVAAAANDVPPVLIPALL